MSVRSLFPIFKSPFCNFDCLLRDGIHKSVWKDVVVRNFELSAHKVVATLQKRVNNDNQMVVYRDGRSTSKLGFLQALEGQNLLKGLDEAPDTRNKTWLDFCR